MSIDTCLIAPNCTVGNCHICDHFGLRKRIAKSFVGKNVNTPNGAGKILSYDKDCDIVSVELSADKELIYEFNTNEIKFVEEI